MRESLASFCQRNDRADLLREWDSEKKSSPHTGKRQLRQQEKSLVDLRTRPPLASRRAHPHRQRHRLPILQWTLPHPRRKRSRYKISTPRTGMEHREKRRSHTRSSTPRQPSHRLVALRTWPSVACTDQIPRQRRRLSRLHQQNRAERRKRPCHPAASPRQRMAPHQKWRPYTQRRRSRQPPQSLVDLSQRP